MCGFAGMVALNGAKANSLVIHRMSAVLHHRGPDDEGIYISGPVGFGFRRLSILDLTPAGHQPMLSEGGEAAIVYNGEIYNYVELRRELEVLGHKFKSTGDTEVLLHAYLEWGRECLHRLNGMWAFLIYDIRRGVIFGSRDRFGKKPLYRYRYGDYVFFGSEIKAILASGRYQGGPNWTAAAKFLYQGSLDLDGGDQTFYSAIEPLPAGSAFELDLNGRVNQWHYWTLDDVPRSHVANPAESFYETFEDALRLRLRSDVPVGIFLSGGLDSTSMMCILAKMNKAGSNSTGSLLAFSYQAEEYDESMYIEDTARQTGVQIVRFRPEPSRLWNSLEQVLWYQDEPVHSMAPVITFELSRLASENGVKVILNGGGPDEYLAGYHTFFFNYWYGLLREGGVGKAWHEIREYCLAHGSHPWNMLRDSLYHQFKSEVARIPALRKFVGWKRWRAFQKDSWFTSELSKHLPRDDHEWIDPSLTQALKRYVERAPLPLYLRTVDRNSMAHSIEARLPFLDYRLVSLAFQLPEDWKMRGPWNKYVLREAMRQRIPESVRSRLDKMGFPVPTRRWFAGVLYERIQDLLASQETRERGLYNTACIRRDLELHREGKISVSAKLFRIAQFEIWSRLTKNYRPERTNPFRACGSTKVASANHGP